jgi:hypothetical protein
MNVQAIPSPPPSMKANAALRAGGWNKGMSVRLRFFFYGHSIFWNRSQCLAFQDA